MIAEFLRAEWDSSAFAWRVRGPIASRNLPESIVLDPDITNTTENAAQNMLRNARGWPDAFLFAETPRAVEWSTSTIERGLLSGLRHVASDGWLQLTGGTRLPEQTRSPFASHRRGAPQNLGDRRSSEERRSTSPNDHGQRQDWNRSRGPRRQRTAGRAGFGWRCGAGGHRSHSRTCGLARWLEARLGPSPARRSRPYTSLSISVGNACSFTMTRRPLSFISKTSESSRVGIARIASMPPPPARCTALPNEVSGWLVTGQAS